MKFIANTKDEATKKRRKNYESAQPYVNAYRMIEILDENKN